jgi:DNA-binding HxlR family transcriptional regulator
MILRDASLGLTRFDQFQQSLGIAPNIPSRRQRSLEKSRYSEHPPRDAYLLADRGRDFRPVLWALFTWGNQYFMPNRQAVAPIKSAANRTGYLPATTDQNHASASRSTEIEDQT